MKPEARRIKRVSQRDQWEPINLFSFSHENDSELYISHPGKLAGGINRANFFNPL